MACKDKKLASVRESNSKAETSMTADQQKKLNDKLDKCKQESEKVRMLFNAWWQAWLTEGHKEHNEMQS